MMAHIRQALFILTAFAGVNPAHAETFGAFKGELIYKGVAGQERVVETVTPFAFEDSKGKLWTVPSGVRVDGASIPQAFWSVIGGPFTGKYREASVVHDYYCDTKTETWQDTHMAFYEGMRANGVDAVTANTMYAAVYWGGPRWVKAEAGSGSATTIVGRPETDAKEPADIVALASKPGVSLDEIRRTIDKALDIGSASSAREKLAASPDCSLVVEPLKADSAAFALCDLDSEDHKLLAARNLKILITDIDTLLSANDSLLLPKIDAYIAQPDPVQWRLINAASRKILRLVSLTMISLNQAKEGLGNAAGEIANATYDPKAYLKSIGAVQRIGATRSMMLNKNISDTPRDPDEVRSWRAVYVELLSRLRDELPKLKAALD